MGSSAIPAGESEKLRERRALRLLAAQAFFLGPTEAIVYTVGNTLFLETFGAGQVPYVYIALGIFLAALFFGVAWLQKRIPLGPLAFGVLIGLALVHFLCWVALYLSSAAWVSFVMMMLFPLGLLLFSILVGGQAGRIFDVRQLKRLFPYLFTSIAVGFIVTSLSIPWLSDLVGGLENLLLIGVGSILITCAFLAATMRAFPVELRRLPQTRRRESSRTLAQTLRNRYVGRLFAYQWFSAVGTQLVIYLFLTQTEIQFPDREQLAGFLADFAGWRNVISLAFLFLLAGPLLTRFGVRLGLLLNPLIVGALIVLMLIVWLAAPAALTLYFWIAVIAYVMDNLLSDGITSTSIKTAYQALPEADQAVVEIVVEGIGVPMAFAFTGLVLLVFAALPASTLPLDLLLTLVVCILWAAVSVNTNRGYYDALGQRLRRRSLNPANLLLEDGSTLEVVTRLLSSADTAHVLAAMDTLAQADHPALDDYLPGLVEHQSEDVRLAAVGYVELRRTTAARAALQRCLETDAGSGTSPRLRGAIVRALCALDSGIEGDGEAVAAMNVATIVAPYLDETDAVVQSQAITATLLYGSPQTEPARQRLVALIRSESPEARSMAAGIIAASGDASLAELLRPLLSDPDAEVRRAALTAAGEMRASEFFGDMVGNLSDPQLRSAAVAALTACGPAAVEAISSSLPGADEADLRRYIRLCGRLGGPQAHELLLKQLADDRPGVRSEALQALLHGGYRATVADAPLFADLLRDMAIHGLRRLRAGEELKPGSAPQTTILRRAIADELDQLREQVLLWLMLHYDPAIIRRAADDLDTGRPRRRALALETLEVKLDSRHKALALPLLDERAAPARRIERLQRLTPVAGRDMPGRLREMILDTAAWPMSWTRACAVYAGAAEDFAALSDAIQVAAAREGIEGETATDVMKAQAGAAAPGEKHMVTIERVMNLKAIDLFSGIPDYVLASVAGALDEVEYAAGTTFIQEGVLEDCLYVIIDGEVRVHRGAVEIITLGRGRSVGELAVLDPEPRSASVTALNDVFLFRLDKESFDDIMFDRPEIGQGVIRTLCRRIREQGRQMTERAATVTGIEEQAR